MINCGKSPTLAVGFVDVVERGSGEAVDVHLFGGVHLQHGLGEVEFRGAQRGRGWVTTAAAPRRILSVSLGSLRFQKSHHLMLAEKLGH